MERRSRVSEERIRAALRDLAEWSLRDGKLHRELRFADFSEAFAFMTRCALVAEQLGHHPEWSNVYDRVTIDLVTHDAGGLTDLDFEFARRVEALLAG